MNSIIYIASSGEGMNKDDLIDYLKSFYKINPQYEDWDFNDITGGVKEFAHPFEYKELKRYFENL
jgi:hypothetical protein